MRVSDLGRHDQLLRDLQGRLAALQAAQHQQATGKRVTRPSDDPAAAAEILRTGADLAAIAQFRKNSAVIRTNLGAEDAVATSLRQLLTVAKQIAIGAAASPVTDPVRQSAITQIRLLVEQVVDLGNTQVGVGYIFGGYRTGAPPFQPAAPGTAAVADTTIAAAEATIAVAGTAAGVYRLTNDTAAPGSVTLTNLSDPSQTETIAGVTGATANLNFAALGVTLALGAGWAVATGAAPGSLDGDTIAVTRGLVYQGDGNTRYAEVEAGTAVPTNHTGDKLFGNALAGLQALLEKLQAGTPDAVNDTIEAIDQAQYRVLGLQAETGAILRQLDSTASGLTSRESVLFDRRRAAEEVDPSEAAVRLLEAQTSLQAAYAATGRIAGLSLTDYLR